MYDVVGEDTLITYSFFLRIKALQVRIDEVVRYVAWYFGSVVRLTVPVSLYQILEKTSEADVSHNLIYAVRIVDTVTDVIWVGLSV